MGKFTDRQANLLKECRYYNGEKKCPFGGDYSYESLLSRPRAYWWYAEKDAVDMGIFDSMQLAIECKIYKHMEMCPISEDECANSYKSSI